jgi:predicted RNA-binding Zn ribbon-like protein
VIHSDNAPGALDLVRRFENTVELPNGPDELGSVEAAAGWCLSHGLPPVGDAAELERLRGFREAVRDVLFANNGEGELAVAWDGLRPFVNAAHLALGVDAVRGLELRPARPESEGAIAALLAVAYEALLDGTWSRLRACRKSSCRFAYYDHTKNGSRAWCSMATCGNQAKAQRRRQRERSVSP